MKLLRSYALNILVKIAKNHTRSLGEYRGPWFTQLLDTILDCPEGPESDAEAKSQTLAVKYFAFNQVLEAIQGETELEENEESQSMELDKVGQKLDPVWPKYALRWIQIGADVMALGPQIRDRKSQVFEGWLQDQADLQFNLIAKNEAIFTKLAKEYPFYMLYTLPTIQARIVGLPGVRASIQKEVVEKPRAATTYMIADWEWISLNKDDISPKFQQLLVSEAKEMLGDREWTKEFPRETKSLKAVLNALTEKPVSKRGNRAFEREDLDEDAGNSMSLLTFQKIVAKKRN